MMLFALLLMAASRSETLNGQQTQSPMFRSGTELVDLYVTVTDKNGRLMPNLTREDFSIFDEDQPQEIVLFENDVRPITVVVIVFAAIVVLAVFIRLQIVMICSATFIQLCPGAQWRSERRLVCR